MTTVSTETVPVPAAVARGTEWDNMRGDASDGESLPPSFPPATRHDMADRVSAQSTSSPETASADSSADESTRYEDRGRQIISGATERVRTGSEELFGRAKAGIKGIAGKLVRLARGGAKTVGEAAGKGASVAVGFAAIEGPKAAKATAKKVSELAGNARSRREAAKTRREQEYGERQRARNEKLGKLATRAQIDAWAKAKIEEESAEHGGKIETLEASISGQKDALEMKEEEVRAAESRFRKAERRLNKLEAKRKRAEERRNQARDISNANPDDIDAKTALTRAEGDLRAIEEQYNAASTIKASLEGKKVDRSSELGTIRTGLGELQGKVNVEEDVIAAGKKWLRNNRVERLEDAASSAFTRVAELVDGSTAAHNLLRRVGRAIKRKFRGGNRQEAKTAA